MEALGRIHGTRLDIATERFATIAAAIYNQAYKRDDGKQFTREEFGAKPPPPKPDTEAWRTRYHQSEDEMRAMLARGFGGKQLGS